MPKKLDEIHDAIVRRLRGKINPRTGKKYTEEEMWAIAQAQYQKLKKKKTKMFTKTVEVYAPITKSWEEVINKETGEKQRFIKVVVSGLKEDRDGERISEEAILDMIEQYKSGKIPLMPNHGHLEPDGTRRYKWQDIMGVWIDAERVGDNLVAVARLNNAHPDAELFWNYIQEGMPIGFSIGAKPIEMEEEEVEVMDTELEVEKGRGEGIGVGRERQGDGGADYCICPNCGYKETHKKGIPCSKRKCPKCGTPLKGVNKSVELKAKITNFEEKRKKLGMSVEEFYAAPRDPPSSSALPIFDAAHVRNAMARFNQTHFRNLEEKKKAYRKILRAAKKFGINSKNFEEKYKHLK